jgi:iron complex outermembrane receptor protein
MALLLMPGLGMAEDMGLMSVDSTTIDDRFESKRGEPSNISVISGGKVEKAHAENIKQVLDAIPGVTAELQSQDSLKIHIRGVENQRFMGEKPGVAVVIDGVPVFERTGRVNINMDDIESIKVVKGGASYLFGDDALAGAVIITTKRGAKMAGGQLSAEGGSFSSKRGLARAGIATDKVAGHVQVSRRDAGSYYYQGQYKADYLNGKLQYYATDSSDLTFGWEVAKRQKDSHGTVTGVTQAAVDPTSIAGRDYARHYNVKLGKFYLTYANDISETSNLMLNLYQFGDHTRYWSAPVKFDAARNAVTDVNAYKNDNDYKQVQRGLKGEWRGSGESLAWMGALDLRDNSYKNKVIYKQDFRNSSSMAGWNTLKTAGTVVTNNKTKERMYAAYAELKYRPLKPLTLTVNGRYDHIKLNYEDYLVAAAANLSKSFNVGSYRAGLNYDFSDSVSLYTNVSTGFRAPTVSQLFAGKISPTGDTAGNPDLDPEQAYNYEIGLRGKLDVIGGVEWDIAAFQIDRKKFILNVAGQYANPVGGGLSDQYQNIGGMRNRGVEVAVKSDQSQMVSMDVAYTYLDAQFTQYDNFNLLLGNPYGAYTLTSYNNSGHVIPRAPKHKLFLATRVTPFTGFTLTGEMSAQSSYFVDELNWYKVGGHSVFNLLANYDFSVGPDNMVEFSVFGRIDNLLDRNYYNTARGYRDSNNGDNLYTTEDLSITVNPGRRWLAGLSAKF